MVEDNIERFIRRSREVLDEMEEHLETISEMVEDNKKKVGCPKLNNDIMDDADGKLFNCVKILYLIMDNEFGDNR